MHIKQMLRINLSTNSLNVHYTAGVERVYYALKAMMQQQALPQRALCDDDNDVTTRSLDRGPRSCSPCGSGGGSGGDGSPQYCANCKKPITERFMLRALDQFWHEDCLKCSCCDCRLGEVGSTLYTRANLMLCKRDYLRLFGATGFCSACSKTIPAFEMVMKAKGNVYHLDCFACQQCSHRFCIGDRYYLHDNRILCEYDYEQRLMFNRLSCDFNSNSTIPVTTMSHIKKQTPFSSSSLTAAPSTIITPTRIAVTMANISTRRS